MKIRLYSKKCAEQFVFIDDEDWELVSQYRLYLTLESNVYYVVCYKVNERVKLHRLILNEKTPKVHIDHIDMNGLNNRKSNLRKATIAQNTRNVGANSKSTTGYKGVYQYKAPNKNAGRFTACIRVKDKKVFGGYFKTAEEAAIRYNELSKKYHGDFGYQNKIDKKPALNASNPELEKVAPYIPYKSNRRPSKETGFFGVRTAKGSKRVKKYVAFFNEKNNNVTIGYFLTVEEAVLAYNNFIINNGKPEKLLNKIPNE